MRNEMNNLKSVIKQTHEEIEQCDARIRDADDALDDMRGDVSAAKSSRLVHLESRIQVWFVTCFIRLFNSNRRQSYSG